MKKGGAVGRTEVGYEPHCRGSLATRQREDLTPIPHLPTPPPPDSPPLLNRDPVTLPSRFLLATDMSSENNNTAAGNHVAGTGRVRKRASEACTFCRRRKVGLSQHHASVLATTDLSRSSAVPKDLLVRIVRLMAPHAAMSLSMTTTAPLAVRAKHLGEQILTQHQEQA
jgi:hypothetical protein